MDTVFEKPWLMTSFDYEPKTNILIVAF